MNKKWTAEEVPSQEGHVAIVTGSSSGIGEEAARILAMKGAEVIIAVRNLEKGDAARNRILEAHPHGVLHLMKLDLADLQSVREFADGFISRFLRLDLLINNAGVMVPPYSKTKDGFELQFGTNHLGHFVLTARLFDLLKRTEGSRVVNVSSGAHRMGKLDFDDLNWEARDYSAWTAYGDSKIANLYFTRELARRTEAEGENVVITAAHPGWTATDLQRNSGIANFLNNFFAMSVDKGALPTLRAAVDDEAESGAYFGPDGIREMWGHPVRVEPNDLAKNDSIAERLWKVSEEMTGERFLS
ncbi:MAG: SDR family NAD(P)-dependent oxidoreductase [Acidobacteriota bacterium]|nr:MAG: SDR family NAD(P)-dependent oxidoreductase [Acidobacteriota bacterium]